MLESPSSKVTFGYHPRLGARPLRDAVERLVGDAVATDLLAGGDGSGELSLCVRAQGLCLGRQDDVETLAPASGEF